MCRIAERGPLAAAGAGVPVPAAPRRFAFFWDGLVLVLDPVPYEVILPRKRKRKHGTVAGGKSHANDPEARRRRVLRNFARYARPASLKYLDA